ncbi:MAG: zinc ribbon domain-containing protein [Lachnospiraceae bacterium]|nr:zinc ribbon domain-containing protein [Lachnospiraceae bacterium]
MIICKHCGKQLHDGARFCTTCGAATDLNRVSAHAESLRLLDEMKAYFNPVQEHYNVLDKLEKKEIPSLKKQHKAGLSWGIIFMLIGVIVLILYIVSMVEQFGEIRMDKIIEDRVDLVVFIIILAIILLGIILFTVNRINETVRKKHLKETEDYADEIRRIILDYYNKSPYVDMIGFEYTDPMTLNAIYSTIQNGMARDIYAAVQMIPRKIR